MRASIFAAAIAAVSFGAMAATPAEARDYVVELTYVAPANLQQGTPTIVLAPVVDEREHAGTALGSIRGGYGNPLKTLVTATPVSDVFARATQAGLAARGLANEAGPHRLVIRLVRLDCNHFFPREAHAQIVMRLEDAASGASLFEGTYSADEAQGTAGASIFSPIEPLRALTNMVMQQTIDRALDDPAFRAALAAAAPAPAAAEAAPVAAPEAETAPEPAN